MLVDQAMFQTALQALVESPLVAARMQHHKRILSVREAFMGALHEHVLVRRTIQFVHHVHHVHRGRRVLVHNDLLHHSALRAATLSLRPAQLVLVAIRLILLMPSALAAKFREQELEAIKQDELILHRAHGELLVIAAQRTQVVSLPTC